MGDAGKLYIVATPIGNMEDITLRALRILGDVDCIAAEDTRVTGKLLSRHDIKKPMLSLNQHNELSRAGQLIERIKGGESIAYCSDAGTPALSDPGSKLVKACREAGIECVPIPGPSALAAAISVAGLEDGFLFVGFLPSSGSARNKALRRLQAADGYIVLYEAPHRVGKTLADLRRTLGERHITIARELTKLHEQIITCTFAEAAELFAQPKGEFVLIIHPDTQAVQPDMGGAADMMRRLLDEGTPRKQAARQVSDSFNIRKSTAYALGLDSTQGEEEIADDSESGGA